jgi:hypothetical protein
LSPSPSAKRVAPLAALADALDADSANVLAFGIGCLYFSAHEDEFDGNAVLHIERVTKWLEETPQISNVRVDDPRISWFENDLPFGLEHGGQALPAIRQLRVDFDLEISAEERKRYDPWHKGEKPILISVSIRQGPALPVAFVVTHGHHDDASIAVSLTWHALREMIPEDAGFYLDLRGPSPAWVDCYLVPVDGSASTPSSRRIFEFQRVVPPTSYSLNVFTYDTDAYDSVNDASEALFEELAPAVELFYEIVGAGRRLSMGWDEIEALRARLLEIETARGLKGYLMRTFKASNALRQMAIDLTEFEADRDRQRQRYERQRRDLQGTPGTKFLYEEIDEELGRRFSFPFPLIERPLALFEQRRLTRGQNVAAFAAALAAAAIGASTALWASGGSGSTTITVNLTPAGLVQRTNTQRPAVGGKPKPRTTPAVTTTP